MSIQKNSPNTNIPDAVAYDGELAYITWGEENIEDKRSSLKEASKALEEYTIVQKSTANNSRYRLDFSNIDGPTSGRPGLTRSDYDYFRPEESIPTHIKGILNKADVIYNRVGLVKNVVDLMGDFACQGIRLVHPNKKIERFYKNWFEKVSGEERSERFLNNFYRVGNVVINRQTGKINLKVENNLYKTVGTPDLVVENEIKPEKREIPWKYTFIDPVYVDVVGGALSSFVGNKVYSINLPATLRKTINSPKNDAERKIIEQLPQPIIDAAKTRKPYLLDIEKTLVFHYKKDDWKTWAYPMIYSIMDDINIIEKLKLADLAALDGAISNIRIFKLGSLEHRIAPTPAAANKLSSILQNNVGGGTMDLVWGPDIELIESKTNVHQFLGEGKYTPHLNSVYAGLGIPPTLTGTYGAAGTTNNFISLKTLTQRLQYGRKVLTSFWKKEIALVQKAMGFSSPAKIEFDRMDLSNEEAEKALLIQLADRNIVSDELIQRVFGFDPDIEKNRLNRETRDRKTLRMVKKAGPFFDANFETAAKKMAMQLGLATPSQIGIELSEKKNGEMNALEMKSKLAPAPKNNFQESSLPGQPQQGRPKNSKDSSKRKTKVFTPQTGASLNIWSITAQDKISDIINPILLDFYNKKNMRSLSNTQYDEAEATKSKIFFSIEPFAEVTEEIVLSKLNTINSIEINHKYNQYINFAQSLLAEIGRPLTAEENKYTKSYLYNLVYSH